MKKKLYTSLVSCKKEEEVKAEFCKFFKMKIKALGNIDHYTEQVLFEFKYDRNFKSLANVAAVLAQVMYYARKLKFGAGLTRYPLPPMICIVDKNEAFFAEAKKFAKFYSSKSDRYDWDRAASTPCPNLIADILAYLTPTTAPYVYDLTKEAECEQFVEECRKHLDAASILTPNWTSSTFLKRRASPKRTFLMSMNIGTASSATTFATDENPRFTSLRTSNRASPLSRRMVRCSSLSAA